MRLAKFYLLLIGWIVISACNRNLTIVYYNDTSKVDDGEIFGEQLQLFFTAAENIHISKIQSGKLNVELKKIKDTLNLMPRSTEPDDGYYGYAFITPAKDTLFSDYGLAYWKSNGKSVLYKNEELKLLIHSIFKIKQ